MQKLQKIEYEQPYKNKIPHTSMYNHNLVFILVLITYNKYLSILVRWILAYSYYFVIKLEFIGVILQSKPFSSRLIEKNKYSKYCWSLFRYSCCHVAGNNNEIIFYNL